MIRLLIADDHPIVRAGLVALFALEGDIDVIAEAATPDEAVSAAEHSNPDVVLMDLQFGAHAAMTGADATRRIRALDAAPYVLVLTNYDSDADILGAVEAGASGYLLKDAPPPRTRRSRPGRRRRGKRPRSRHRLKASEPHASPRSKPQ
jgi:DNA-binding NarL/FixJ family response regulator